MILCDESLRAILPELIPLSHERDVMLVNPASIDVRIGRSMLREVFPAAGISKIRSAQFRHCDLTNDSSPVWLEPGEFVLVELYESITVPNGYAVELKLKSSRAREGYNHSLAFWVDPGWNGYLTMEIHNVTRYAMLPIYTGMRFAQIIIHQLDFHAKRPYHGRYQNASGVEQSKLQ